MYHRRIAIFSGAAALSSFFALGVGGSRATAGASSLHQAGSGIHLTIAKQATIRTEPVVVGSKVETVLVDSKGLPLYYFRADTPTKSKVSGSLAGLWPPVVAARPTATGVQGKVVALKQAAGPQVSFKGHFLYTFIDDSPGHVTGQGVSNFFVVTPKISTLGSTPTVSSAASSASHGYGY
jgi:predicted lipoprotein with Yx(FWY)xxD motif